MEYSSTSVHCFCLIRLALLFPQHWLRVQGFFSMLLTYIRNILASWGYLQMLSLLQILTCWCCWCGDHALSISAVVKPEIWGYRSSFSTPSLNNRMLSHRVKSEVHIKVYMKWIPDQCFQVDQGSIFHSWRDELDSLVGKKVQKNKNNQSFKNCQKESELATWQLIM